MSYSSTKCLSCFMTFNDYRIDWLEGQFGKQEKAKI